MSNSHQANLLKKVQLLFAEPKYSDLQITSNGNSFDVHRAVVCSSSKVLAMPLDHNSQEKKSGQINQDEFSPRTVARALQYMYTGDYTLQVQLPEPDEEAAPPHNFEIAYDRQALEDSASSENADVGANREDQSASGTNDLLDWLEPADDHAINDELMVHIRTYQYADYLRMPALQALAVDKFRAAAAKGWQRAGFIMVLASVYAHALPHHQGLLVAAVEVARDHAEELLAVGLANTTLQLENRDAMYAGLLHQLASCNSALSSANVEMQNTLKFAVQALEKVRTKKDELSSRLESALAESNVWKRLVMRESYCRCKRNWRYVIHRLETGFLIVQCVSCGQVLQ